MFTASLSFFTAGICFGWSSPSLAILQSSNSPFPVDNNEASWIAAFLPIGSAVGPFVGSYLSRYLGPKHTTIISAFPYLAGFVLIIFANGPIWLYLSRFISGFAVGFGQTATPIYVAEIAENRNRGALLTFFTFSMGIGSMFSSFLGPYLTIQVMAEIASIFPVLLLATMLLMPDSPYYLVRINKEEEAEKSLKWLRRQKNDYIVQEEMMIIKKSASENLSLIEGFKQLVFKPNPKALGIVNVSFLAQGVCGAIVVMFYQEQIYQVAEVPIPAEIAVMITGVVGNTAGFLSIMFVDRWGRKPLLLVSSLGCALSTGCLGTYIYLDQIGMLVDVPNANWTPLVCMNALQIFFAFGLAPIPSTQLGELFSSNVKEIVFCLISCIGALEGFLITKLYQIVQDAFGITTVFWCLSTMTFLTFLIMIKIVPETKSKSFLEIQHMLLPAKETPLEFIKMQDDIVATRF